MKLPRRVVYGNQPLAPFGGSDLRQVRRMQRKTPTAFAVLLVPSAQNNQYAKVAHIGVACPKFLQEGKGEYKSYI